MGMLGSQFLLLLPIGGLVTRGDVLHEWMKRDAWFTQTGDRFRPETGEFLMCYEVRGMCIRGRSCRLICLAGTCARVYE